MTNLQEVIKEFNGRIIEQQDNINDKPMVDQELNEVYINVLPSKLPPPQSEEWNNISTWSFRLITTYSPRKDEWIDWNEKQKHDLIYYLKSHDVVISYNWSFDRQILSGINSKAARYLSAFSMMDIVSEKLGFRLRLQNLANNNGCYGNKRDLNQFLKTNPSDEELKSYNRNKIYSLNCLTDTAIKKGYLNYWGVGENRKMEKMTTGNWQTQLAHSCVQF